MAAEKDDPDRRGRSGHRSADPRASGLPDRQRRRLADLLHRRTAPDQRLHRILEVRTARPLRVQGRRKRRRTRMQAHRSHRRTSTPAKTRTCRAACSAPAKTAARSTSSPTGRSPAKPAGQLQARRRSRQPGRIHAHGQMQPLRRSLRRRIGTWSLRLRRSALGRRRTRLGRDRPSATSSTWSPGCPRTGTGSRSCPTAASPATTTSDVVSGKPDEEVFAYEAAHDKLICASCNPSGARPIGVFTSTSAPRRRRRPASRPPGLWKERWLSGSIAGLHPQVCDHRSRLRVA